MATTAGQIVSYTAVINLNNTRKYLARSFIGSKSIESP